MKKIIYTLLLIISLFTIVGCANRDAKKFKEDYEKLNGQTNSTGKIHRSISIDENNPFVYTTAEDIVKKIDNKETFYLYVGDDLCPWCRSTIESAIKIAKENKIDKIYYVSIWDDNGKEILRDKYEVNDEGKLVKTIDGTESYNTLVEKFNSLLRKYTITDKDGNEIDTNEKRIYAPNYFYIENGEAKKLITGKSDKQTDSRGELTDEIKKDQEEQFRSLFKK